MDRDALRRWLDGPARTWRWNDGDRERYRGVEAREGTLRWFRWSHMPEDGAEGGGGHVPVAEQSYGAFLADGAPAGMDPPGTILCELRGWLEEHTG